MKCSSITSDHPVPRKKQRGKKGCGIKKNRGKPNPKRKANGSSKAAIKKARQEVERHIFCLFV